LNNKALIILKGETMNESDCQEIGERLRKLEKQNRNMKRVGILLVIAVGVVLFMGAASKPGIVKEIKAERIAIVDSNGKERIVMEMKESQLLLTQRNQASVMLR
jgi:hypothetical protein